MSNPAKPTALKILQGNPGKRPLPENEPKPKLYAPNAPRHLSDDARKHWRTIVKQLKAAKVMTRMDTDALAMYCETYTQWIDAMTDVKENGMLIEIEKESKIGVVYTAMEVNAHVKIAAKAFDQLRLMLAEFGMTPASRTRVAIASKDEEAPDPWKKY